MASKKQKGSFKKVVLQTKQVLVSVLFLVAGAAFLLLTMSCFRMGYIAGGILFLALAAGDVYAYLYILDRLGTRAKTGKEKKQKTVLISCTAAALSVFLLIPSVLAIFSYEGAFGRRFETPEDRVRYQDEFPGLAIDRCYFPSNKGQLLAGYIFTKKTDIPTKGVLILSHGIGFGGCNAMMDLADYFASRGYVVFGYDVTGNDSSEGSTICGLPQGVLDLSAAIEYIENDGSLGTLPIVLFGHSWGGYSVSNVLNLHPEVKAVVSVGGFDHTMGMVEAQGRNLVGGIVVPLMPYVSLYERVKLGSASKFTAIKGFEKSDARIMIVHSSEDTVVPAACGIDLYEEIFGDDSRFTFVRYEDRGHPWIYYSDAARAYREDYEERYIGYIEKTGGEDTEESRTAYAARNMDRQKMYELDTALLRRVLTFYDRACSTFG